MATDTSPDIVAHVERLLPGAEVLVSDVQNQTRDQIRRVVFEYVFADKQLQKDFKGAAIRYTSTAAVVTKNILRALKQEAEDITITAIGDVTIPDLMVPSSEGEIPLRQVADRLFQKSQQYAWELTRPEQQDYGYDYTAKGYKPAREMAFKRWDRYYEFSDHEVEDPTAEGGKRNLMETLTENSTAIAGGMPALAVIVKAFNDSSEEKGLKKRYMYPDSSLPTWEKIIKTSTSHKRGKFNVIRTEQKDLLHLTPEKVHEFYKRKKIEGFDDTWYVTPVGNPTGTRMRPEQLTRTCEAIIQHNPNATIILDCVYLRTLEIGTANELIRGVLSNPAVLDRIMFVDSLSKTDGITGLRAAMFFSANKGMYDTVQTIHMADSAGAPVEVSAKLMAYSENPDETDAAYKEMHRHWGRERKGLFAYLIKSGKFTEIFDEDQSHILPEQLDEPCGPYLDLKLKDADAKAKFDVWIATGCIGVPTPLLSGPYMRFALGKITKPTYSKYAEEPLAA